MRLIGRLDLVLQPQVLVERRAVFVSRCRELDKCQSPVLDNSGAMPVLRLGGATAMSSLTNADFLDVVFSKLPIGASAWVTGFAEDPHTADHRCWHGRAVIGRLPGCIQSHHNTFYSISTFRPGPDGVVHRRKENFAACHVIMLDDIGSKIPEFRLELDPSYLFETSPGNFQAGYLLDPPELDRAKVERLLDAMVGSGLAMDGSDPGMKGCTRYARMPEGWNNKSKYVERLGAPFLHQIVTWEPTTTYTIEEIAKAYVLDLNPRVLQFRNRRAEAPPWASAVLCRLSDTGLYLGPIAGKPGWHNVLCPWRHIHTDGDITGTAYAEPSADNHMSGGFCCHHGHCLDLRDIRMLVRYLDIRERAEANYG